MNHLVRLGTWFLGYSQAAFLRYMWRRKENVGTGAVGCSGPAVLVREMANRGERGSSDGVVPPVLTGVMAVPGSGVPGVRLEGSRTADGQC